MRAVALLFEILFIVALVSVSCVVPTLAVAEAISYLAYGHWLEWYILWRLSAAVLLIYLWGFVMLALA